MSAILFILGTLLGAHGTAYTDTFVRANNAYKAGNYAGAIQGFEQLVSEHVVDPSVFYDLGNAYYRSGKLGPAIVNYERALQLDPGFESAQQNLAHCVSETKQHLPCPLPPDWEQSLLFWHYNLRPATTRWLALGFWLLFWLALGFLQWRKAPYVRSVAVVAATLAVAFGGSAWVKSRPGNLAVARFATVPVRYGTDVKQTVRYDLHEGDRVTVDGRDRGWVRVKTAGGDTGWTQAGNLILVGPPYKPLSSAPSVAAAQSGKGS